MNEDLLFNRITIEFNSYIKSISQNKSSKGYVSLRDVGRIAYKNIKEYFGLEEVLLFDDDSISKYIEIKLLAKMVYPIFEDNKKMYIKKRKEPLKLFNASLLANNFCVSLDRVNQASFMNAFINLAKINNFTEVGNSISPNEICNRIEPNKKSGLINDKKLKRYIVEIMEYNRLVEAEKMNEALKVIKFYITETIFFRHIFVLELMQFVKAKKDIKIEPYLDILSYLSYIDVLDGRKPYFEYYFEMLTSNKLNKEEVFYQISELYNQVLPMVLIFAGKYLEEINESLPMLIQNSLIGLSEFRGFKLPDIDVSDMELYNMILSNTINIYELVNIPPFETKLPSKKYGFLQDIIREIVNSWDKQSPFMIKLDKKELIMSLSEEYIVFKQLANNVSVKQIIQWAFQNELYDMKKYESYCYEMDPYGWNSPEHRLNPNDILNKYKNEYINKTINDYKYFMNNFYPKEINGYPENEAILYYIMFLDKDSSIVKDIINGKWDEIRYEDFEYAIVKMKEIIDIVERLIPKYTNAAMRFIERKWSITLTKIFSIEIGNIIDRRTSIDLETLSNIMLELWPIATIPTVNSRKEYVKLYMKNLWEVGSKRDTEYLLKINDSYTRLRDYTFKVLDNYFNELGSAIDYEKILNSSYEKLLCDYKFIQDEKTVSAAITPKAYKVVCSTRKLLKF